MIGNRGARSIRVASLAIGVVWLSGCGGNPATSAASDSLTTRARQEAIGRSGLPGATGINRALQVADSAAAHRAAVDSLVDSR